MGPSEDRAARTPGLSTLHYGGWRWSLLLDEDPRLVTGSIDSPEVERFLCWDGEADVLHAVMRRWRRDLAGEAITLVARQGDAIAGWAGLLLSDEFSGALQTSTFLHPAAWGTGLNTRAKHVQWAVADGLGHRRMLLEIDGDNLRSQAAAWKQFPSARVLLLAGASEPEAALVLEVAEPPCTGTGLTLRQRETLGRMLARHPGWRIWHAA